MSPVVSTLLLGLVLFWLGTQAIMPAVAELINVCPRFNPSTCSLDKPGPEGCKTDSQCLWGKKCCCSNRGLKCVYPEQVKPGRCPPVLVRCATPLPDPKCHSDLQCLGKKKCCGMCGISCMNPVEEPRGVCPASEAGRSLTCRSFECSRDSDCRHDEKCCVSGDGKKCLQPFKVEDLINVCPRFDPSTCLFSKPGPEECKNDSKCMEGKKCCCSNCGLTCVTPEQVKPGRCPPVTVRCETPLPDPKCHSDLQCPGKKKCCEMCGISCMNPVEEPRGVCPASEVIAGRSPSCPSFECSRDADCWPDEKCCVSGDGKRCVKLSKGFTDSGASDWEKK